MVEKARSKNQEGRIDRLNELMRRFFRLDLFLILDA